MLKHNRVLIFRNKKMNMIKELFNYEFFVHDFKNRRFVICFGKHDSIILDFTEYSFVGEYRKLCNKSF